MRRFGQRIAHFHAIQACMLFRKLVEFLANNGEKLLWFAICAFATAAVFLSLSAQSESLSGRIAYGVSKSAACLMTLDSPATIAGTTRTAVVARSLAWLVSLSGWLLIPTLIAALLSSQQELQRDTRDLEFLLKRCAEEMELDEQRTKAFVAINMQVIESLSRVSPQKVRKCGRR